MNGGGRSCGLTVTFGSKKYFSVSDMPRNISVRNRICALLSSTALAARRAPQNPRHAAPQRCSAARSGRTARDVLQRRGLRVHLRHVMLRACCAGGASRRRRRCMKRAQKPHQLLRRATCADHGPRRRPAARGASPPPEASRVVARGRRPAARRGDRYRQGRWQGALGQPRPGLPPP